MIIQHIGLEDWVSQEGKLAKSQGQPAHWKNYLLEAHAFFRSLLVF